MVKKILYVQRLSALLNRISAAVRFRDSEYLNFHHRPVHSKAAQVLAATLACDSVSGPAIMIRLRDISRRLPKLGFHHPLRRFWYRVSGGAAPELRALCIHSEPEDMVGRARSLIESYTSLVENIGDIYPDSEAMKRGELRPWSEVRELTGGLVVARSGTRSVTNCVFIADGDPSPETWSWAQPLLWTGSAFVAVLNP